MSQNDLSQFSLLDLFRTEAETQIAALTEGLLALERDPGKAPSLESMMRAAHSLKGAARIVNLTAAVQVAHAMEDCFVIAQSKHVALQPKHIDSLLLAVDLVTRISQTKEKEIERWEKEGHSEIESCLSQIAQIVKEWDQSPSSASGAVAAPPVPVEASRSTPSEAVTPSPAVAKAPTARTSSESVSAAQAAGSSTASAERTERVLRVKAEHVNHMLGLAGESLVESRWLRPFAVSLLRVKQLQSELGRSLEVFQESLPEQLLQGRTVAAWERSRKLLHHCQELLSSRFSELEMFDRRSANLSHRLYHEALACRMRPFSDGLQGFPRMVRDVARVLGKEVQLQIVGENTQVDRDILEKLEAPLTHLVRNAVDHGLELPDERLKAGKPRAGTLKIEARHSAGRLLIIVAEDGRGIEIERVRRTIVKRGLATEETAARLNETELLEFLFLPGFSVREQVTEFSGRGVGLDVVQSVVKGVRGTIRVFSEAGKGTRFQMQLPLTLSVLRALLVEVDGEPYAFPLASVLRTVKLKASEIESLEGHQYFRLEGKRIGLVSARQIFQCQKQQDPPDPISVVVIGETNQRYGLAVDRFIGERELVVQPLDPRLGKIPDISSGSVMEDGSPVLIADVEDVIRSVEKLSSGGSLNRILDRLHLGETRHRKKILVVDDSVTVRELQRKLLVSRGYDVEIAVDGMDGWNAVRAEKFDLVITDVDMPRLDGVELITWMKRDTRLRGMPTMIVSYKDREEDRKRGMDAGADLYLSKANFNDDHLLRAVVELIGQAHITQPPASAHTQDASSNRTAA